MKLKTLGENTQVTRTKNNVQIDNFVLKNILDIKYVEYKISTEHIFPAMPSVDNLFPKVSYKKVLT